MAVESRVAPNCVGLLATRRVFDSLAWELMEGYAEECSSTAVSESP